MLLRVVVAWSGFVHLTRNVVSIAAMFVDELRIHIAAGDGGDGVVRWRQEKFKPMGGPSGGNGGNGGDVYIKAVPDINRLSKYVGAPEFAAEAGEPGRGLSQHGKNAEDLYIDLPVGSIVHDEERDVTYTLTEIGQTVRVLKGGRGGLGNEYFKSSTNRSPTESTTGKSAQAGYFTVEVALMVDVGFIGLPNAGKSSLVNALTNASAKVGAYPFTTLHPSLGALYEFTLADIPGVIAGAATGKGLGHRFLRHITRTKMLVHVISLESPDVKNDYYTIRDELSAYDESLQDKEEWVVLSKKDLAKQEDIDAAIQSLDEITNNVLVLSVEGPESIKSFSDALVQHLRTNQTSTPDDSSEVA